MRRPRSRRPASRRGAAPWLLCAAAFAGACNVAELPDSPAGDAIVLPASTPTSGATPLPTGWQGTGVLARRDDVPSAAPAWAAVVAEVVEIDGVRLLRTSGKSPPIHNASLARAAADNRARAELARWLGTEQLIGSEVIDAWTPPGEPAFARAQIRVPSGWQPGSAARSPGAPPPVAPAPAVPSPAATPRSAPEAP